MPTETDSTPKEPFRQENNLVLLLALTTFVITGALGWMVDYVNSPWLFFQYAIEVRKVVSGITLVAIVYSHVSPSPGRRGYYYALMGIALAWLAAMIVALL